MGVISQNSCTGSNGSYLYPMKMKQAMKWISPVPYDNDYVLMSYGSSLDKESSSYIHWVYGKPDSCGHAPLCCVETLSATPKTAWQIVYVWASLFDSTIYDPI